MQPCSSSTSSKVVADCDHKQRPAYQLVRPAALDNDSVREARIAPYKESKLACKVCTACNAALEACVCNVLWQAGLITPR